jgi:hypothetical protein
MKPPSPDYVKVYNLYQEEISPPGHLLESQRELKSAPPPENHAYPPRISFFKQSGSAST